MNAQSPPLAYRVPQAAEVASFSERKMWRLVKSGRVRARKDDGVTLILREDLEAYLRGLPAFAAEPQK